MTGTLLNILCTGIMAPLLPILLIQGQGVRKRTPRLPEAGGPASGLVIGAGQPFRLIVLGESTVAGVGAQTHEAALTGQIAMALGRRTGRAVQWLAVGRNGVTAETTRTQLVPLLKNYEADMLVIALGVNDVLRIHSPARWSRDLGQLTVSVRRHLGHIPIVWAGVPPMAYFPAFPQPLRAILGCRSKALDSATARLAQTWPDVTHCPTPIPDYTGFAADGFHPGPVGYSIWGDHLAVWIISTNEDLLKSVSV